MAVKESVGNGWEAVREQPVKGRCQKLEDKERLAKFCMRIWNIC